MPWQHRVVRRKYDNDEVFYQMHEYFYGDKIGNPVITTDPINLMGDSVDALRETLGRMLRALDAPVLEWSDYESEEE